MSIMSITPRAQYFQGISREDVFDDKLDWYWPEFQQLGEQAIRMHEIYYDPKLNVDSNMATFGYTPRYAELKTRQSEVHGQFRTSLLHWHLGRNFGSAPGLNDNFIRVTPEQASRIFAVTDTSAENNHLLVSVQNNLRMRRPLMKNPIPALI